MAGLIIAPRARIFHGHDWVYATEVQKAFGNPQAGDVISLKDFRDRPLGTAIYNPESQIVARRLHRLSCRWHCLLRPLRQGPFKSSYAVARRRSA